MRFKEVNSHRKWIEKDCKSKFDAAENLVQMEVWQGYSGSLSLKNWMMHGPLFIGKLVECSSVWNDEFWRKKLKSQKLISKKMGSCEVLAGWFWLSKLEEMDGGWPSIYREGNENENCKKQGSLEGNWVKFEHEWKVTSFPSKLNQISRFGVLITSGSSLNMIRRKITPKNCI